MPNYFPKLRYRPYAWNYKPFRCAESPKHDNIDIICERMSGLYKNW